MALKDFFVTKQEVEKEDKNALEAYFLMDEYGANTNTKDVNYVREMVTGWTFNAVDTIAKSVMFSKLYLYKTDKNGKRVEVTDHPALRLLQRPNTQQMRWQIWWLTTVYLETIGEALWIFDEEFNPQEMVVTSTVDIDVIIDKNTGDIKAFKDKRRSTEQKIVQYPAERCIFLKLPAPHNPLRGKGTSKYIARTIEIDNYTEEYLRSFFKNNARPAGFLAPKTGKIGADSMKRLYAKLQASFGGARKAHKTGILPLPFEWIQTGQDLSQLQMTERDESIKKKVLASYKVPESLLGIMDKVNANSDVSERIYARNAVKPILDIMADYLNNALLPFFGANSGFEFVFENPVKEDEKLQAEIDTMYVNAGILTVNEVREMLGYEAISDGDKLKGQSDTSTPSEEKTPAEDKSLIAMKNYLQKEADEQAELLKVDTIEKAHEMKINFSNELEGKMTDGLINYFNNQQEKILSQIEKVEVDLPKFKEYVEKANFEVDEAKEERILAKLMRAGIISAVVKQSRIIYLFTANKDKEISATDKEMLKFVDKKIKKASESIVRTTIAGLDKAFNEAGDNPAVLTDSVIGFFDKRRKEASSIARTEISGSAGYATERVYKEVGAVGKKWRTSDDEKVCQFCGPMDGTVIPIDKNFFEQNESFTGAKGGKISFTYGKVSTFPLHMRCRCDLEPVYAEEEMPEKSFEYKELSEARGSYKLREAKLAMQAEELEIREAELKDKEEKIKN